MITTTRMRLLFLDIRTRNRIGEEKPGFVRKEWIARGYRRIRIEKNRREVLEKEGKRSI